MATSKSNSGTSSIADFKRKNGGLIELPSGLVVKLRQKGGMRAFLASGIIPNSLMGIIQEAINKGSVPDMSGIIKDDGTMDEAMINDMLVLTDRVVVDVMVSPPVQPAPTEQDMAEWNRKHKAIKDKITELDDERLRDENSLYVDEMDDEDKMFIFQWVTGGTRDVEQFRKELASTMDDLAGQPSLPSAPKRTSGTRRR